MSEQAIHPKIEEFYAQSRAQAEQAERYVGIEELEYRIASIELPPLSFSAALTANRDVAVIAEHKRRSPSEGDIRPYSEAINQTLAYQRGGAAAVSILTNRQSFSGTVTDIRQASSVLRTPILRKDFISTSYQLYEAAAAGASAVLLIAGPLDRVRLAELHDEAEELGLEPLVEAHDERDLDTALDIDAKIVGINNRNLSTLQTDIDQFENLADDVPNDVLLVAESGYDIKNAEHIARLRAKRATAVLIGTALMRSSDPAGDIQSWLNS